MTMRSWLGPNSHERILTYAKAIQEKHRGNTEFRDKLESMDEAYYRARIDYDQLTEAAASCKSTTSLKPIEVPLVLSEVDSIVAFLADAYLSQYPLFPVLSSPANDAMAKALSAKIDEHALLGRWGRQLLLFFKNAARYNISALQCAWQPLSTASVANQEETTSGDPIIEMDTTYINKLTSLDMYNTFWDTRHNPADVTEKGEWAGYNELMNKPQLKELINTLGELKEVINAREALNSTCPNIGTYYIEKPVVSDYISTLDTPTGHNWLSWAKAGQSNKKGRTPVNSADNYLITHIYARVLPVEFDLKVAKLQHPQIWHFILVNMTHVIHAKRLVTPYNFLPIVFGDLQEDGFGIQTQSVAENVLPYQDAATELLNIRLTSARRALGDRGLYNPKLVTKANINDPGATAKIPVNPDNYRDGYDLGSAYRPIPFDHQSTAGTIQDMQTVIGTAERMNANNSAKQGQFRQGNRTLGEFNTILTNAANRQRTSVILLEHQVFIPIKAMIKFNILQYGTDGLVLTMDQNPQELKLDVKGLRDAMLNFRVADGHTPKERLMNPELLQVALQTLPAIPELNAEYSVGDIFSQFMWLAGNIDIKQFKRPQQPQLAQQPQQQPGVDPNAPQPEQPTQ